MNPPLPFHIQRVVPPEGAVVAGAYLPADISIRMAIYAMHHDPRYYKVRRW